MPELLALILAFLKTGIFAVGGGYATLPYLREMAVTYGWFTLKDLADVVAISEVTPGPVGINMATFAGYLTGGVGYGIAASLALVALPTLLILILTHFVPNLTENAVMKRIFYGLVPTACALICGATLTLLDTALLRYGATAKAAVAWGLLAVLLFLAFRFRLKPHWLLLIGAVAGLLLL